MQEEFIPSLKGDGDMNLHETENTVTACTTPKRSPARHHLSKTISSSNVTRRPSFSILRSNQTATATSTATATTSTAIGGAAASASVYAHHDSVAEIRRKVNKSHQNSSPKPPKQQHIVQRRTSFVDHNPSAMNEATSSSRHNNNNITTLRSTRRLSQYSATSSQTSGSEKPSWFRRYMYHNAPGQMNTHHLNPNASLDPSLASMNTTHNPCAECICCLPKGCKFIFSASPERIRQMRTVKKSRAWKFGFNIFCIVLLFGKPFQTLVLPMGYDSIMDFWYIVAFLFFLCDILFMCYLSPNYATFVWRRKKTHHGGAITSGESTSHSERYNSRGSTSTAKSSASSTTPPATTAKEEDSTEPRIKLGSFSFWTELISVVTLLLDLSFVGFCWGNHGWNFSSHNDLWINFNSDGSLYEPYFTYTANKARLLRYLVIVSKTSIIARFVHSSGIEFLLYQLHMWWKYGNCCFRRGNHLQSSGFEFGAHEGSQRSVAEGGATNPNSSAGVTQNLRNNHVSVSAKSIRQSSTPRNVHSRSTRKSSISSKLERVRKLYSNDRIDSRRRLSGPRGTLPRDAYASLARIPERQFNTRRYGRKKGRSRVGGAMNEATVKRVAVGIFISLVSILFLTYQESDDSAIVTSVVLHNTFLSLDSRPENNSSRDVNLEEKVKGLIDIATKTTLSELLHFEFEGESMNVNETYGNSEGLRALEIWNITICGESDFSEKRCDGPRSTFHLSIKQPKLLQAALYIIFTFFVMILWYSGVAFFAGPISTLVVNPIERMIRLLRMIMKNPLGYEDTKQFKQFTEDEEHLNESTSWGKDTLKGMETSFLMSTISQLSSLLKVGYGSAGAEIIRQTLERSATDDLMLRGVHKNSTVSCIFLFCDIRRFTDSTECLREEIFLFSNRVAAVVHTICHSFGGLANKNIGDAYLLCWTVETTQGEHANSFPRQDSALVAFHNQSDKALLSVVKISMALNYTSFFFETVSEDAKERLKKKFGEKEWNFVKLGFGLHAGKAVQGAIGSERKVDATYISKAVDQAEYLEISTKRYHVPLLMSSSFHNLLHKSSQRRCRKIDQVFFADEEEDDFDTTDVEGLETMGLYTFDMDVDALLNESISDSEEESMAESLSLASRRREPTSINSDGALSSPRRWSVGLFKSKKSVTVSTSSILEDKELHENTKKAKKWKRDDKLILPEDVVRYDASMWQDEDITIIRKKFSTEFFLKFNNGLSSYIAGDWDAAKVHFDFMVEHFDDGPSKYFLKEMKKHNFIRPWNFNGYSEA